MIKTPVSILQEMMVKDHKVANYELIQDGFATHTDIFTYQVTCDGLTATGTERTKKAAKQEAAKAMLEVIATSSGYPQLPAPSSQTPVRTPLPLVIPETERLPPDVPFVNSVGSLRDLCVQNRSEKPVFLQISATGPPHSKVFTFECIVANFREVGVARTKKQARQVAAKKMLHKLMDILADLSVTELTDHEDDGEEKEASLIASPKKINLGFKLSGYHIKVKDSLNTDACIDFCKKLESHIPEDHSNITKEFVQEFQLRLRDILSSVNLVLTISVIESSKVDINVVAVKVNTSPEIVQIATGCTEEDPTFHTLKKLINSLLIFLK